MIRVTSTFSHSIVSAKNDLADAEVSVSLIEEVSRQTKILGAIDLGVGNPLGLPPKELRQTVLGASDKLHDYGDIRGISELRSAIAKMIQTRYLVNIDFERQIVITNGATEGLTASVLALLPQNSEVIIFEPFYSPYLDVVRLCGLIPRFVSLSPANGWQFSERELKEAFNSRTAAIILNMPHNPTGRVFNCSEMRFITDLCLQHDVICISDEVYDEIFYTSARPLSVIETPLWSNLAIKIGSFSKIYAIAGWRIGYVAGSPHLIAKILSAHEVLTGGAANPMQAAATAACTLPERYYRLSRQNYRRKRDLLYGEMSKLGFSGQLPQAGLFLTLRPPLSKAEDNEPIFQAMKVLREAKVGVIPLGAFYSQKDSETAGWWRICFARPTNQLKEAVKLMSKWIQAGEAIKTHISPTKN